MEEPTEPRKPEGGRVEIASAESKDRFGELLGRAAYGGERIVITRFGKPIAAFVGLRDLETLEAMDSAAA